MKFPATLLFLGALPLTALADPVATNDMGRPGGTANHGTLGSGTAASTPSDRAADLERMRKVENESLPSNVNGGRETLTPPHATVNSGVDRTTTTATTGSAVPFASVDTNDDGQVDRMEAQVLHLTGHDFDTADADRDQMLSGSEYQRMAGSRSP